MYKNLKILDCTFRDGGYYTTWDFNQEVVLSYFKYAEELPIDYIEVGYRSTEKKSYLGEYFYLPKSTIKRILNHTTKKVVIMLNAKDFSSGESVRPLLEDLVQKVTMVRIAVNPFEISNYLALVEEIKDLGFEIGLNLMYISKLIKNIDCLNNVKKFDGLIDYLYLVDSYGGVYPSELRKIIQEVRSKTNIPLGFHGHNNMELAFSNTLTAIEEGVSLIDSTVLGMGRGAGNLKTELLLTHLKTKAGYIFDMTFLSKLVELFIPLKLQCKWGGNLPYMVSGSFSLPQQDVMEALSINRYSLSGIVNSLDTSGKYESQKFCMGKYSSCLLVGGGENVEKHINAIQDFIDKNKDLLVIHSTSRYLSIFDRINNDQILAVAGDELLKVKDFSTIKCFVLEPSPRKINVPLPIRKNSYELNQINFTQYKDSPLAISLQIAKDVVSKQVFVVGFDGYKDSKTKKQIFIMNENQKIINDYGANSIISFTPTNYKNLIVKSIYANL